jgi:hypothetical protein
LVFPPECIWSGAVDQFIHPPLAPVGPVGPFESVIVLDFPEIFAEFRGKQFLLVWRGSRHGFTGRCFDRRYGDRRYGNRPENTLTVILDTEGNIFGAFNPDEWYCSGYEVFLRGCRRCLFFTLKDQHDNLGQKFELNDIHSNEIARSVSERVEMVLSSLYADDNRDCKLDVRRYRRWFSLVGGRRGSFEFAVKDIEVFEITD